MELKDPVPLLDPLKAGLENLNADELTPHEIPTENVSSVFNTVKSAPINPYTIKGSVKSSHHSEADEEEIKEATQPDNDFMAHAREQFMEAAEQSTHSTPKLSNDEKKGVLLGKLQYYRDNTHYQPRKLFTKEDSIENIESEVFRIDNEIGIDQGIASIKSMMNLGSGAIAYVSEKFENKTGIYLKSWPSDLRSKLETGEFDVLLRQMSIKYGDAVRLSPGITLAVMLIKSMYDSHVAESARRSGRKSQSNFDMAKDDALSALASTVKGADIRNVGKISYGEAFRNPQIKAPKTEEQYDVDEKTEI